MPVVLFSVCWVLYADERVISPPPKKPWAFKDASQLHGHLQVVLSRDFEQIRDFERFECEDNIDDTRTRTRSAPAFYETYFTAPLGRLCPRSSIEFHSRKKVVSEVSGGELS